MVPPQESVNLPITKQVFTRNHNVQSTSLASSNVDTHIAVSTSADIIQTSVCICIVMNTTENLETISQNLVELQMLFDKSFVVFVTSSDVKSIEWCRQHRNSLTLVSSYMEEYKKRNMYLKFVHENRSRFEYMMVVDPLISLTTKINPESFNFFKKNVDFNVMCANQTYKYYDIESLVDGKRQVYTIENLEAKKRKIKQYQVHIPKNTGLIPVSSAFGGFAVYKIDVLEPNNKYTTDNHISFNLNISTTRSKMYIDPSFLIETNPNNYFLYEK
jgi:hypothetical protein